jgi:hypothetical protein
MIAYFFGCIWFYFPDKFEYPNSWLERYDYKLEPIHDKFWASMYYVYTTVSTTGYGDIVPDTTPEFAMTFLFMFGGVTFYSLIYSTIMRKLEEHRIQSEAIFQKKDLLRQLFEDGRFFKGQYKDLYTEMLALIDEYKDLQLIKEIVPVFKNIRPQDVEALLLETCTKLHRFEDISFFRGLPKYIWLKFQAKMQKRVYLPGDVIYHEGSVAKFFFVIKRGKVWCIESSEDADFYPFMQIDSYFGSWEAINHMRRGWTVMAKTKTVIFSLHMRHFDNIFKKTDFYKPFMDYAEERYRKMHSVNRECGRNVRRFKRVQGKMKKVKMETVGHLLQSIELSKNRESNKK